MLLLGKIDGDLFVLVATHQGLGTDVDSLIYKKPLRQQGHSTKKVNSIMPYLTQPGAQKTKEPIYRYFVELASNQLDYEGVPKSYRIVDVVVLENSEGAIKAVIAAIDWLQGFKIVAIWSPDDSCPF